MLPEELTRCIGKVIGEYVFQVEREAVRRYADAIGDYNPLYWDEEYAKKSKYCVIIVPPGLITEPWYRDRTKLWSHAVENELLRRPDFAKYGFPKYMGGGADWEFYKHVKAGELIRGTTVIKDIYEREGKAVKIVFEVVETIFINEAGEKIMESILTFIHSQ